MSDDRREYARQRGNQPVRRVVTLADMPFKPAPQKPAPQDRWAGVDLSRLNEPPTMTLGQWFELAAKGVKA